MAEAVLICNGPSATGYEAPTGVYACCLNGGFRYHKADAAVTVDCPGSIRSDWHAFQGEKVVAAHMPEFPSGARFECLDVVQRFGSSTPAALLWLAQVKRMSKVTIVGLDSLRGGGDPRCKYNKNVVEMLQEMRQYFVEGLFVEFAGKASQVGSDTWLATLNEWQATPLPTIKDGGGQAPRVAPSPAVESAPPPVPKPAQARCTIPQIFVEIDPSPKCTRKCAFCDPGIPPARRKQKKALTLKAHNAFIDELAAVGFNRDDRWLCYCGHGEPTLNKSLFEMIRYARTILPLTTVSVYTNGDPFTEEMGCTLAALDVDYLFWDVYDEISAKAFPRVLAKSTYDPARVRVVDHISSTQYYTSRCSSVKPGNVSEWINHPCGMTGEKMLVTDDGNGGIAYLLCCDNLGRESLVTGKSLLEYTASIEPITAALKKGDRSHAHPICAKCDRNGSCGGLLPSYPKLTETAFWPPNPPTFKVEGKRLVVMPANAEWARHAEQVLATIKRASNMDGETLLIWNEDGKKCPDYLRALADTVWEYKKLGWCGITTGIAQALRYAVERRFDWVIKLDTDTAIMLNNWDSLICADCPKDAQAGTYMDETLTGGLDRRVLQEQGLFNPQLKAKCRWAKQYVERGLRGWGHMQGGCYVIGLAALERIERVIGLLADEQVGLPEGKNVGEDVYLDTKCKVAGVRQLSTLRARSWYRKPDQTAMLAKHVLRQRDTEGVCAVHPIKDLDLMKTLARGIRS